jgi:hypothetical protein
MALWQYNPSLVVISIAGLHTVVGVPDGEFVTVTKNNYTVKTHRSLDGEKMRVFNNDNSYSLTLSLVQSSPSNTVLDTLFKIDQLTRRGKFPITISDLSGSSRFYCASAWIETVPDMVFANDLQISKWKIMCSDATMVIGDNTGSDAATTINTALGVATAIGGL